MKKWILAVSMAANQFFNALIGGNPQMSTSARAGYAREAGSRGGRVACAVLEAIDFHPFRTDVDRNLDHCQIAVRNYEARMHDANR